LKTYGSFLAYSLHSLCLLFEGLCNGGRLMNCSAYCTFGRGDILAEDRRLMCNYIFLLFEVKLS